MGRVGRKVSLADLTKKISKLKKTKRSNSPSTLIQKAKDKYKKDLDKVEKVDFDPDNDLYSVGVKIQILREKIETLEESKAPRSKIEAEKVELSFYERELNKYREAALAMDNLKYKLESRTNPDRATERSDEILDNSPVEDLPRPGEFYADEMDKLNQITRNRVTSLDKIYFVSDRPFAAERGLEYGGEEEELSGRINVGNAKNQRTAISRLWHEFGHHIEFSNPEFREAANQWLKDRSNGESPVKLKDLFPDMGYEDWEMVYPGNYMSPYAGKFYEDGSTEVISMGFEQFSNYLDMLNFFQTDPDHFYLILGVLDEI